MEEMLDKPKTLEEQLANLDENTIKLVRELMKREQLVIDNLAPEDEDRSMVSSSLEVKGDKRYGVFVIIRKGKGHVPKILKGSFTEHSQAVRAIELYSKGLLKPSGKFSNQEDVKSFKA